MRIAIVRCMTIRFKDNSLSALWLSNFVQQRLPILHANEIIASKYKTR